MINTQIPSQHHTDSAHMHQHEGSGPFNMSINFNTNVGYFLIILIRFFSIILRNNESPINAHILSITKILGPL